MTEFKTKQDATKKVLDDLKKGYHDDAQGNTWKVQQQQDGKFYAERTTDGNREIVGPGYDTIGQAQFAVVKEINKPAEPVKEAAKPAEPPAEAAPTAEQEKIPSGYPIDEGRRRAFDAGKYQHAHGRPGQNERLGQGSLSHEASRFSFQKGRQME